MAVTKVGEKALTAMQKNQLIELPTQRAQQKVLDEEAFVEDLEKIIQRDFFPDLPKLRAQTEYLRAKQRNDLVKMRELALKFVTTGRQQSDTATPQGSEATPSTFETPDLQSSSGTPRHKTSQPGEDGKQLPKDDFNPEPGKKSQTEKSDPTLSLDKYLAKHTSEDNASFVEIMESAKEKERQKNAWLYEAEANKAEEQAERLRLEGPKRLAIQGGTSNSEVKTWTYTMKNMLMYVPDGMEKSSAEKIDSVNMEREIKHGNTRFEGSPFAVDAHRSNMAVAAALHASKQQGRIGPDGKELVVTQGPAVNGFGFVSTPSPAPGVNESPLMTWGEIEGTPFRLDSTPSSTLGPQFKMPDVPRRDRLGLSLVEKASKQHRAKKEAALKRVTQNLVSPSPKRFGSSERMQYLSPAARRLVSRSMSRVSTDKSLRASYTPSPRSLPGDKTPAAGTPTTATPGRTPDKTPKKTPARRTPKRTPKTTPKRTPKGTDDTSLTDNLLDLKRRSSRAKAADFF